jgi:hypothetical protein
MLCMPDAVGGAVAAARNNGNSRWITPMQHTLTEINITLR